jgi:hypothetical protein
MKDADQPAQLLCEACADIFCEVCFAALHRKGSRKHHTHKRLDFQLDQSAKSTLNGNGCHKDSVRCFLQIKDGMPLSEV